MANCPKDSMERDEGVFKREEEFATWEKEEDLVVFFIDSNSYFVERLSCASFFPVLQGLTGNYKNRR